MLCLQFGPVIGCISTWRERSYFNFLHFLWPERFVGKKKMFLPGFSPKQKAVSLQNKTQEGIEGKETRFWWRLNIFDISIDGLNDNLKGIAEQRDESANCQTRFSAAGTEVPLNLQTLGNQVPHPSGALPLCPVMLLIFSPHPLPFVWGGIHRARILMQPREEGEEKKKTYPQGAAAKPLTGNISVIHTNSFA